MTRNETEQLLQRFMDGLTTRDEERRLRHQLAAPDSPREWDTYRLMLSPMPVPEELLPQADADAEYWSMVNKRSRSVRRWAVAAGIAVMCCLGVAAGVFFFESSKPRSLEASTPSRISTEKAVAPKPDLFIFDNVEMEQVAATLARHYNVQPVFENEAAKHVRLYFQVEKSKTIAEVVELLNHFSKVSVTLKDKQLIIK